MGRSPELATEKLEARSAGVQLGVPGLETTSPGIMRSWSAIGSWTHAFVPSGKVASTWTSRMSSGRRP